jgi:hypothetical protein
VPFVFAYCIRVDVRIIGTQAPLLSEVEVELVEQLRTKPRVQLAMAFLAGGLVFVLALMLADGPSFYAYRKAVPAADYAGFMDVALTTATLGERQASDEPPQRKLIRRGSIRASADDPKSAAETLQKTATELGGYVAEVVQNQRTSGPQAVLRLRVPAPKFEEMRQRIHAVVREVLDEKTSTQEVTKQYFDLELTLRNQRAEEEQYLKIMKQATSVKDVLEVTQSLSDVRESIHRTEGELRFLTHEIEMSAWEVTLIADEAAQAFGSRWRPLVRIKEAFYEGLDEIGEFGSSFAGFVFMIPAILLWVAFLTVLVFVAWKLLRFIVRVVFRRTKAADSDIRP